MRLLATILVSVSLFAADLRLRTGDALWVTGWGTSAPVTVTFSTNHGLQVGDLLTCHGVQGQQNINSNVINGQWAIRKVKQVVSATTVSLTDGSDVDIQPIPGAVAIDLSSRMAGNQYGWCGKVQTYSTAPFPRGIIPQSGANRTRIENNASSNPNIYSSLKTRLIDPYSGAGCDGSSPVACSTEEAEIAGTPISEENPGTNQGDPLLMLSLSWLKTGNTQHLNSAKYYLKNIHRYLGMGPVFAGCYSGLNFCGNGQNNDWANLALHRVAHSYSIIRDQLTSQERADFAAKMLNGCLDGNCTNQMSAPLGNLAAASAGATTITGTGMASYQPGDIIVIGYDLATLIGSRGDISSINVSGGVATVTVNHTAHRFKVNRFITVAGAGSVDTTVPVVVTAITATTFQFATSAPDGPYSTASATIRQYIYNAAEGLGRHKVVSNVGGTLTISPGLSFATIGSEHRRTTPWTTGNCGFLWYTMGHNYYPAAPGNRWTSLKVAAAISTSVTTIPVSPDTWSNVPAGTGWFMMWTHSNGVTVEIMQVTGRDDVAKSLTVTRGMYGSTPLSKSSGATLNIRIWQPMGNAVSPTYTADFSANHIPTRLAPAIAIGLALADDDSRAITLTEAAWAYWRDITLWFIERHWTGLTPSGGNDGYAFGRWSEMVARIELNLRNSLTSQPYNHLPFLESLPSWSRHWITGSDYGFLHFFTDSGSDSGFGNNLWGWLPVLHSLAPSTESARAVYEWKTLKNGAATWNLVYDIAYHWLIYLDESEAGSDFRGSDPPWIFARNVVASSEQRPFRYWVSRTNWGTDPTQVIALYPSDPVDHIGGANTYGNYRLFKKALLLGPITDLATGTSSGMQSGVVIFRNAGGYTAFRGGNAYDSSTNIPDDMRYGSPTARFLRLDCLDCYWKPGDSGWAGQTVPITRHYKHYVHLPTADGNDYVVQYDNWAASASVTNILRLNYWMREWKTNTFVPSPANTFGRTGADIENISNKYTASLRTRVILPSDTANITHNALTNGVEVLIQPANGTSGEFLVTHRLFGATTGSIPTTTLLTSDANHRALQISDSTEPKVVAFPTAGANDTPSLTSTHSGTGRYVIGGLSSGTYTVQKGGVDYLTGLSVRNEVGTLEFTGTSGSYAVSRTGNVSAISISPGYLPVGVVSAAYSQSLSASGGTAPYTWSVINGSCPGLSLSSGGVLSGTPSTAGPCTLLVKVTDNAAQSATESVGLIVQSQALPLEVTTTSLPGGTQNQSYSQTLTAQGGVAPYVWSLFSGSLPTGLSLSSGGVISGTPTGTGTSNFTVRVTDSQATTDDQALSITITANNPLTITTASPLLDAQVGSAYSNSLSATGGTAPYTWSAVSGFPAWLSISSGGVLSGTPDATGSHQIVVRVTDNVAATADKTFDLTVDPPPPPSVTITTTSLPSGGVSVPYSASLAADGGVAPYTWSVFSGSLPTGLSLSGAGVISGTPTTAGESTFSVQVSDSQNPADTYTKQFTILIVSSVSVKINPNVSGTNLVFHYGGPFLLRSQTCTWAVLFGGNQFASQTDSGGSGRRPVVVVTGLPQNSLGEIRVTCGPYTGVATFTSRSVVSGSLQMPMRLTKPPGVAATHVTIEWGIGSYTNSQRYDCATSCSPMLTMTRNSIYQVRVTWDNSGTPTRQVVLPAIPID